MKVLLDENLPIDLRHFLAGHQTFTVAFMGWKGLSNGTLLARAAADGFDVVVIRDSGVQYQQNLSNLPVAVIMLPKRAQKLEDLVPLIPALLMTIGSIAPKTFVQLT